MPGLLNAQSPRYEKVTPNTRIRLNKIKPGDVLLSYDGGLADRAIAWAGKGVFSHAGIFLTNNYVMEAIFKGSVITRLKVLDFERNGRHLEPLLEIPHATRAGVYRNELFLSQLRSSIAEGIASGKIIFTDINMRRPLSNTRALHEAVECMVGRKANRALTPIIYGQLSREYPPIADVVKGFSLSIAEDEPSRLHSILAKLGTKDAVHGLFSKLEKIYSSLAPKPKNAPERPPLTPGYFCSQLVCEAYSLAGFPLSVPASTLAPSALAMCPEFSYVEGAIVQDTFISVPLENAAGIDSIARDEATRINKDSMSGTTREDVLILRAKAEIFAELSKLANEAHSNILDALGLPKQE